MVKQKKIEPLVSEQLIRKVKELETLSRAEKAKACGYYSVTKKGRERVNMKQFLNALIEAEGIELNENHQTKEDNGSSASYPVSVQATSSTNLKQIIKVNRVGKPTDKPKAVVKPLHQQEAQIEAVTQVEIEQLEQPEPVVQLESVAELAIEESVCSSGWSLAELMNEFSGRVSGWG